MERIKKYYVFKPTIDLLHLSLKFIAFFKLLFYFSRPRSKFNY